MWPNLDHAAENALTQKTSEFKLGLGKRQIFIISNLLVL